MAGWSVALTAGAAMAPATFSASGLLDDFATLRRHLSELRRQTAGLRAGHPEQPDDRQPAAGGLRQQGHRPRYRRFQPPVPAARCGTASGPPRARSSSPGRTTARPGQSAAGSPAWRSTTPRRCRSARRRFDASGALANPDEAIGEIVNTTGGGMFGGYYNDPSATDERLRHGMYWSGTWATAIRTGGSTWPAPRTGCASTARTWRRPHRTHHSAAARVSQVAVYPVPDEHVGDQVMAAIVLADETGSPRDLRGLPGHPVRPVPEGVAAACLDRRSAAGHRHQQGRQSANSSPAAPAVRRPIVDAGAARPGVHRPNRGIAPPPTRLGG